MVWKCTGGHLRHPGVVAVGDVDVLDAFRRTEIEIVTLLAGFGAVGHAPR